MPVFVLAHDDDDMSGILGVYSSVGVLIEHFCKENKIEMAEQRDIMKEISSSAMQFNSLTMPESRAYFVYRHYNYAISEYRVKD